MKKFFKKLYAFSVVESLMALLLIGIVSVLTFPSIVLTYKKYTTAVTLKDTYKELNMAITNMSIRKGCTGDLDCKDLLNNFGENLADEYKTIRFCKQNETCWKDEVYLNLNDTINTVKNASTVVDYNKIGQSSFIDAKNKVYNIQITDPNCNIDEAEDISVDDKVPNNHKLHHVCGYITVDIDGEKKINSHGVDVFKFVLTNTRNSYLYPYGAKYHNKYWKKHNTCQPEKSFFDGQSCAGRIMDEGWKVNYINK